MYPKTLMPFPHTITTTKGDLVDHHQQTGICPILWSMITPSALMTFRAVSGTPLMWFMANYLIPTNILAWTCSPSLWTDIIVDLSDLLRLQDDQILGDSRRILQITNQLHSFRFQFILKRKHTVLWNRTKHTTSCCMKLLNIRLLNYQKHFIHFTSQITTEHWLNQSILTINMKATKCYICTGNGTANIILYIILITLASDHLPRTFYI